MPHLGPPVLSEARDRLSPESDAAARLGDRWVDNNDRLCAQLESSAHHTPASDHPAPVRNVWSENMAVRRTAFEGLAGFAPASARSGSGPAPTTPISTSTSAPAHRTHIGSRSHRGRRPRSSSRPRHVRLLPAPLLCGGRRQDELSSTSAPNRTSGTSAPSWSRRRRGAVTRELRAGKFTRAPANLAGTAAAEVGAR